MKQLHLNQHIDRPDEYFQFNIVDTIFKLLITKPSLPISVS